jgi:hypothetical protein
MTTDLATASNTIVPLPDWQVLEYEQQAFWVTARSRVELAAMEEAPDNSAEPQWQLRATSSVASNAEEVTVRLAASNGRALQRSRFSEGKGKRYKSYDFLAEHLVRERRDPPAKTTLPPAEWPLSSSKKIAYPEGAGEAVITDAYALLELAGRFLTSTEQSAEVVVSTDINFYRVHMTHSDGATIKVDYRLGAEQKVVSGKIATRAVKLQVSPLGTEQGKPDFSLLGLHGEITLLFDLNTTLPLQLRGTAPRLGDAQIELKAATLRAPPQ